MPEVRPMNPRISVITIFYNAAAFLCEAIESVLAQEYRDLELLLVDVVSSDASTAIARRYAEGVSERGGYIYHCGRLIRVMMREVIPLIVSTRLRISRL